MFCSERLQMYGLLDRLEECIKYCPKQTPLNSMACALLAGFVKQMRSVAEVMDWSD